MSVWTDIGGILGATSMLIIGAATGIAGWRRRKAEKAEKAANEARAKAEKKDADKAAAQSAERQDIAAQKAQLEALAKEQMKLLSDRVKKVERELQREKADRERDSERFFRALSAFRSRDWMWSDVYHRQSALLKAAGLEEVPLPDELKTLPRVVEELMQPAATDTEPDDDEKE